MKYPIFGQNMINLDQMRDNLHSLVRRTVSDEEKILSLSQQIDRLFFEIETAQTAGESKNAPSNEAEFAAWYAGKQKADVTKTLPVILKMHHRGAPAEKFLVDKSFYISEHAESHKAIEETLGNLHKLQTGKISSSSSARARSKKGG